MKTLFDDLAEELDRRSIHAMSGLLKTYESEKNLAKCYATFAYLGCGGAGGNRPAAEAMGALIESFYMATSIHDDVVDGADEAVAKLREQFSANTFMVLGNCFFVQLGTALARAMPEIAADRREQVLQLFERFMMDVAESQIVDVQSHWETPSPAAAERQMKLRGGTWGRFCLELPGLAGGLEPDEARVLGDAGERLFLALTIRDDLRDLTDDILNGVLTLAPSLFFASQSEADWRFTAGIEAEAAGRMIEMLHEGGAIHQALDRGREHTKVALRTLDEFLQDRSDMHWYLLLMLFRLMVKQFDEFTPQHVLEGRLGIGISEATAAAAEQLQRVRGE